MYINAKKSFLLSPSIRFFPTLYDMLPPLQRSERNQGFFQPLLCRTEIFKNSFLSCTINEWNKLDPEIRRIDSYVDFRKKLLSFTKPMENKTFSIYDPLGIKLRNRLSISLDITLLTL